MKDTVVQFFCYGHPNILATHPTTLEFTKDAEVTLQGDCIIGVRMDVRFESLKKLLFAKDIKIILEIGDLKESFMAKPNPTFSDEQEIVIRTSPFLSRRTLAIHATKAAIDLPESFRQKLKDPKTRMQVTFEGR